MAGSLLNTNNIVPQCEFLDPLTKRPARPWLFWLQNPSIVELNLANPLPVKSGGTGNFAIPTNGQLLIGNGSGYAIHTLSTGNGISVTNGAGTITLANTGVLSFSAGGTGFSPSSATTGNITLDGTLATTHGGTGLTSYVVGDMLYASGSNVLAKLAKPSVKSLLYMDGTGAPVWQNSVEGGTF